MSMTDEEKQAKLAAEAEAKAEAEAEKQDAEFEESIANLSDEDKEAKRAEKAKKSTSTTDYSAELEKELAIANEKAIKAEKALAEKRFKNSEKKREDEEDNDDKPLTKAELSEILAENEQKNKKVIQKQNAEALADRLAGSEDEKKLILAKWENRTFPANYSLEEQIKESYVLANGNKLIAERDEALRALKGKSGINRDTAENHIEPQPTKDSEITGDLKTVIGRRGFVFNNQTKQYEKTTANGKKLIYDKKTGAVYPEGHKFA
jgi:hypothetical protein